MCGIWVSLNVAATREVIDIIAHRGPDGDGWKNFETISGDLIFGHRRLAIIATDASGLQPLSYDHGRYWIVFNGEIYNYRELRAELEDYGQVFKTSTDTEVILAAYAEWGTACLQKFNGMFALAIHDRRDQTLFIARDRFGVKPLYFFETDVGIAFASEIKQFTVLPGFCAKMNASRVRDFFLSGLKDHTAETFFDGVLQLRGGECVFIDLKKWHHGLPLAISRWYALPKPDTVKLSLKESIKRFEELMRDSVRLRLRADVSVGSCLSGGLDSSTIVCLANEVRGGNSGLGHHTFTCAFEDSSLDEWSYAKTVVEKCQNESHVICPSAVDLWSAVDDMIWHQDEPFGSTSIFAQWSVFKEARVNNITVMLDGQGADETLAGYHTVFGAVLAGHLEDRDLKAFFSELRGIRKRHGTPLNQLALLTIASMPKFQFFVRLVRPFARFVLLLFPKVQHEPIWISNRLMKTDFHSYHAARSLDREQKTSPLGHLCSVQLTNTSVPMLLHFEDRNSMAHSIEARVPFLDYRVVELAIGLGELYKVADGETKVLLRKAMSEVLPEKVLLRQDKLGFPTPEERWFRTELKEQVRQACRETIYAHQTLFDVDKAMIMVNGVLDGDLPFSNSPWRIMCFGRWVQRFNIAI